MRKISRFLLPAIFSTTLIMGGFSCNLLTGPHNSTGADTTSSNFIWTIDTIGAEGSILYDCCVINDTLAYAVGLIMPADSVGRNNTIYWDNAAVWNGTNWTPMQVPLYYQGKRTFSKAHSVFARNENDVWFGMGYLEHWDGHQFSQLDPQLGSVENKIWESSDGSQIYVVGNYGKISYSSDHGTTWQQVQTGTTLPFQDIWGDGGQVLAVASDKFGLGGKYLVELNGNTSTHLSDIIPTAVSLSGIWFVANQKYFLVGDGIYEKHLLSDSVWQTDSAIYKIKYYPYAVRGDAINDVVLAGEGGTIAFFNGEHWTVYSKLQNGIDRLLSISMKDNLVVIVGSRYLDGVHNYGVIYVGRR